jgi:hypothetical protein
MNFRVRKRLVTIAPDDAGNSKTRLQRGERQESKKKNREKRRNNEEEEEEEGEEEEEEEEIEGEKDAPNDIEEVHVGVVDGKVHKDRTRATLQPQIRLHEM